MERPTTVIVGSLLRDLSRKIKPYYGTDARVDVVSLVVKVSMRPGEPGKEHILKVREKHER